MIDLAPTIYVFSSPVDMRKSIDTLAILTQITMNEIGLSVNFSNMVFVFLNKSKNKIKILMKDGGGFLLLYKRLDQGCFKFKMSKEGLLMITKQQLRWLFEGADYTSIITQKFASYTHMF